MMSGMRLGVAGLVMSCVSSMTGAAVAQDAAPVVRSAPATGAASQAGAESPMTRPSEILQGPLTALQQALSQIRLEKWKMSGELRDAADADLRSIERNFRETLPPLLATADGEPGSVAKVLPVLRNVDAVYDVALRVSAMGRLTAPAQQSAALEQALGQLSDARHRVGDQVQQAAVAEDGRLLELQASVAASQAAAAAAAQAKASAVPPQATKPVVRPKKKPRPKPATSAVVPSAAAPGTAAPKQP